MVSESRLSSAEAAKKRRERLREQVRKADERLKAAKAKEKQKERDSRNPKNVAELPKPDMTKFNKVFKNKKLDPDIQAKVLKRGFKVIQLKPVEVDDKKKYAGFFPMKALAKTVGTFFGSISKDQFFNLMRKDKNTLAGTGRLINQEKGHANCRICNAAVGTGNLKIGTYVVPEDWKAHYGKHGIHLNLFTRTIKSKAGNYYKVTYIGSPTTF